MNLNSLKPFRYSRKMTNQISTIIYQYHCYIYIKNCIKVICNQIYYDFEQHDMFCAYQYGFRKQHSTYLAVSELVDRTITILDDREAAIHLFLNLPKAFDTLEHIILPGKLCHCGYWNIALHLFKSYVQNHKQYVEINEAKSDNLNITTVVPQGSVIGPLLLIIYINNTVNRVTRI